MKGIRVCVYSFVVLYCHAQLNVGKKLKKNVGMEKKLKNDEMIQSLTWR